MSAEGGLPTMRFPVLTRCAAALLFLVIPMRFSQAVDPYQLNQKQPRAPEDPEKFKRPVTNELKGAEIKEYRDKLNAVKAQVFREGGAPAGSSLRAIVKNAADPSSPSSFVATGRFDDFSPAVRQQIESKLNGTPRREERVEVQVEVGPDAVAVATARVVPSEAGVSAIPAGPASGRVRGVDVARPQPPAVVPPSLRARSSEPAPNNSKEPKGAPAAPAAAASKLPIAAAPPPAKAVAFPGLPAAAKVLVGAPAARPAASEPESVALIPVPEGDPLVVTSRGTQGTSQIISINAPAARLPQALKNQVRAEKGPDALPDSGAPVEVTVEVRADRTIRIVDVKAAAAAPADAKAPAAEPAAPNAPLGAQPPAPAPAAKAPSADNAAVPAPVNAPAPGDAAKPSGAAPEPFPVLSGAKTLAASMGLDPAAVRLQAPRERADSGVMTVPTAENRIVRLEAVRAESEGPPTAVRASGRFGDFAPATQGQIREILGRFNAAPLIDENSEIVFEARPAAENRFEFASIAVRDPENPTRETVMIWKEGLLSDPEAAPPPAEEAGPNGPLAKTGETPTTQTAAQTAERPPRPAGLAPAAAALATKAYGLPDASYQIKRTDPKGGIRIDPVTAGQADVVVETPPTTREGFHDFEAVGKNVDFTDAIRAQVDEKLRDAVENGETWADDALKGNRQLQITFEVDDTAPDGPVVRVKDVAPTMQDAARDAAKAMGLRPGDFFLVNVGDQALIVLERGAVPQIVVGDSKLKIVSPDGDAKVFVNPGKSRKDPSVVLMLSRESLKANRAALARVGGPQGEAAIKAAMDGNPKAGEFIVRVDPSADDEKIVIKAMQNGSMTPGMINPDKKPEDKP